ncbi:hypothetical protein J4G37_29045 [Microvirga sp. 3-52]|nr:hypothetical protein [Microvirga sp. 3-52]
MGDVLGRQIERADSPRDPDKFAEERDVAARTAVRIEHRPAGLNADKAERFLIFGPGGLEVGIQPRGSAPPVAC